MALVDIPLVAGNYFIQILFSCNMIQIGKYRLGFAPVSMIIVFVILSVCAIISAVRQARPEWPMPLWQIILINEGMALLVTLVYGILVHFAIVLIDKFKG